MFSPFVLVEKKADRCLLAGQLFDEACHKLPGLLCTEVSHVARAGEVEFFYRLAVLLGIGCVTGVVDKEQGIVPGEVASPEHGLQQASHRGRAVAGNDKYPGGWQIQRSWHRGVESRADGFRCGHQARLPEHIEHIHHIRLLARQFRDGGGQYLGVLLQGPEYPAQRHAVGDGSANKQLCITVLVDQQHAAVLHVNGFTFCKSVQAAGRGIWGLGLGVVLGGIQEGDFTGVGWGV